ncbi:MAG: sensor histidine kinase [Bacteroidetes bacterium]|nr:MAG: sensor histidine kinase [Bacteroidota bacterium]REK00022.1 MAG: sensor histidine kinase [Bacteroidota bacterium]REK35798.1 MAG: sensor histidine kinase [Bacteroidota bacterium]REK49330.1 MAG: sensor histidine kinase [Bacteroidota bacterium]
MNRRKFQWIIGLMSVSLLGIIFLQVYWIMHDIRLKEQQFDQNVTQAMNAIVDRIETKEAMTMLHERLLDIDPGQLSKLVMRDSPDLQPAIILDTIEEPQSTALLPPNTFLPDLDNADINIEFHHPGSRKSFLKVQRRNYFHQDSLSKHTIRSSQIMRFYGDSAEVIIRQNEEKIKARIEKLSEVVQKMAVEFSGPEKNIDARLNPILLDSIISAELCKQGINVDYDFGIWNGDQNKMVFSKASLNPVELINSKYKVLLFPNDIVSKPDFLVLNFPSSIQYVLSSMWLMLLSSTLFTILILFGFGYTIHTIIRQKKLSDIKSDFINNMTHEFKTPIATISLAVDSMKNPKVVSSQEKLDYFSNIIRQENRRMNAQVENVLQMAQIEKGELRMKKEEVNVHQLIQKGIELIGLQIQSRNGQIQTQFDAEIPLVVSDPVHLSNVIINLLDNANKYSPESPEILVSTSNNQHGLIVSVKDKGIGMNRETQKRVFEKFYRVPTGNLHDVKGFGLGLSYVKAIIDSHNGWIDVESEPGKGSTFEFFIPYK